jgi:hypothetical protein
MHARETRPAGGTLHGNIADGMPCPLRSVPYTAPGEGSHWGLSATPVSARGSPAQKPRSGAARAVMQAGAAAVQIRRLSVRPSAGLCLKGNYVP